MHELPVTESILAIALESAENAGATRIRSVELAIGDLSSFVDESVQFYFDQLSRGTLAEGATLVFQRIPATCTCADCGAAQFVTPPLLPVCPACASPNIRIEGGREFQITGIDVELPTPVLQENK